MDRHKTVLLVDDEEDILACVSVLFKRHGYRVIEARDGIEALEKASNTAGIDLIVLDVMMPRLDGFSALLRLRKEMGVQIPIIMLTAKEGHEFAVDGYLKGADFYISKPFEIATLLNAAEYCVNGSRVALWPSPQGAAQPFAEDLQLLPSAEHSARPGFGEGEDGTMRHILIIDDDEDARTAVAKLLKLRGFTSQEAQNAFEAMDLIKAGTRFGLILLDHSMPGKTGLDFLGWLKKRPLAPPPVVMISGHSTGNVIQRAYEQGVELILAKPITVESLDTVLVYFFSNLRPEQRDALRTRMLHLAENLA